MSVRMSGRRKSGGKSVRGGGSRRHDDEKKRRANAKEDELRMLLEAYSKQELETIVVELLCGSRLGERSADALISRLKSDVKWCKLFVHQLAFKTESKALAKFYSQFGTVKEAVVLVDKNGNSKGYGFVTFSKADDALRAASIHKRKIDGRLTHCSLAWKGNPNAQQSPAGGHISTTTSLKSSASGGGRRMTSAPASDRIKAGASGGRLALARSMAPALTTSPTGTASRGRKDVVTRATSDTTAAASRQAAADRRLFVHSLAWATDDADLRQVFEAFGEVEEAAVIREKKTGKSKGYGFVTFAKALAAKLALESPDKIINERVTHCNYASDRDSSSTPKTAAKSRLKVKKTPEATGATTPRAWSRPKVRKLSSPDDEVKMHSPKSSTTSTPTELVQSPLTKLALAAKMQAEKTAEKKKAAKEQSSPTPTPMDDGALMMDADDFERFFLEPCMPPPDSMPNSMVEMDLMLPPSPELPPTAEVLSPAPAVHGMMQMDLNLYPPPAAARRNLMYGVPTYVPHVSHEHVHVRGHGHGHVMGAKVMPVMAKPVLTASGWMQPVDFMAAAENVPRGYFGV